AEKLKTKYLQVRREDAVKLPEGRYFVVDIVGCKVIDTKGEEVGEVKEVIFTGSNDVYWVRGKKDVLVPVIDSVVKDIDVENSKIIIEPVEVWNYED
ncbi:MAG: 16S rRNA processing protein RimM, partial [Clostridiales bacterium]|nr:16S rRNA processing protein RimM [Clostridiales bacterium]